MPFFVSIALSSKGEKRKRKKRGREKKEGREEGRRKGGKKINYYTFLLIEITFIAIGLVFKYQGCYCFRPKSTHMALI